MIKGIHFKSNFLGRDSNIVTPEIRSFSTVPNIFADNVEQW
jgi:hypothetical protein